MSFKQFVLLCIAFGFSSCSYSEDYSTLVKKSITASLYKNESVKSEIRLSDQVTLPVTFDATSKGNGTLTINGLVLRVFDQHDDGVVYKNDYLALATEDLDTDGIKELIIIGTLLETGEKETDPVISTPVKLIYKLSCKTGHMKPFNMKPNIFIEISNHQQTHIPCN